jgi:hypothetical protein
MDSWAVSSLFCMAVFILDFIQDFSSPIKILPPDTDPANQKAILVASDALDQPLIPFFLDKNHSFFCQLFQGGYSHFVWFIIEECNRFSTGCSVE